MKNKIRIIVLGILGVAITLTVGLWAINFQEADARFWSVILPVVLGEIMITVWFSGLLNSAQQKSFPLKVASGVLPWLYWLFALIMVCCYSSGLGNYTIWIIQAIGLFIFLGPYVMFVMAGDNIENNGTTMTQSCGFKDDLNLCFSRYTDSMRMEFPGDQELFERIGEMREAIRFAADSIPEIKPYENEILSQMDELHKAWGNKDRNKILQTLSALSNAFSYRESYIKTKRL